ncbi:MAG: thiamine-monophosphate kinase [Paraglaciecola psychrophila]|jgi:thiamine-monophosphate kinase
MSAASASEFDIIKRYFTGIGAEYGDAVILSVGDDCALISLAPEQQLALSIDTLVAGRHFPASAGAADIAQRTLAVAISDLAAMGAKPVAFTLAITLPSYDRDWLEGFSAGLKKSANHYQIPLVGGDTTAGPLSLTVQVQGSVPVGAALRRSGAKVGDAVYVSGFLGDAAAALAMLEGRLPADDQGYFHRRFYQPQARVQLGQQLLGVAHSAIDISDGLLADAGHIASASGVCIRLNADVLPRSKALQRLVDEQLISSQQARAYALTGGDDYELCFTAPPQNFDPLAAVAVVEIGRVVAGEGVQCLDHSGAVLDFPHHGFQHF